MLNLTLHRAIPGFFIYPPLASTPGADPSRTLQNRVSSCRALPFRRGPEDLHRSLMRHLPARPSFMRLFLGG